MSVHVFAAVLLAALFHAAWNTAIKQGGDRVATMLLLALVQAAIALPLLPFVVPPDPAALGWIVAGMVLHTGYKVFLVGAYDHADLSQVYPLARGTAPLVVMLISVIALGAAVAPVQIGAVVLISAGVLTMALKGAPRRMAGRGLAYALGTAGFTAGYTLVDGTGARVAGTPSGYILWMVVGDAVLMGLWAVSRRGPAVLAAMRGGWRSGCAAGALSLASYWIAVWAFTQAPLALVAALRETSILFSILIAALWLREPVGRWRWAAATLIAAGIVAMRL
ncbi:EamA family transporter [Mesobaculum littorinae]|uniref:EamA family transporter n=1 Tax=Mesobaculum littorinae TaxID=2486419 RepID=A0A438ADY2_9RHOB|nr:DMT family transporter [Mesobaculum littorinae]RVV96899.1 EamA family transporter [Mesobaculum littorinae]